MVKGRALVCMKTPSASGGHLLLLLLSVLTGGTHSGGDGNCRTAEVVDILKQIDTVILHHSLNVDPSNSEDQGSMVSGVSEFHDYLVMLCHQMNSNHLRILLNKVLVGVYKRRGHTIKYLVSLEGNLTVRRSDVLSEWGDSTGLLVELLGFTKLEECGIDDEGVGDGESEKGVVRGGANDEEGVSGGGNCSGEGMGGASNGEGVAGGGNCSGERMGGANNGGGVAGGRYRGQTDDKVGNRRIEVEGAAHYGTAHSASTDMHPLELAVKLGLMDVVSLLVEAGMRVCPSSNPFLCSGALHHATINQDLEAMRHILELVQAEWATDTLLSQQLCDLLTLSKHTFGRSPLDIAYFQCNSGLSCETLTHLLLWVHTYCVGKGYSPPVFPYRHLMCHNPIPPRSHGVSQKDRWLKCVTEGRGCDFEVLTGHWRVYGDHSVGRTSCGLARIAAGSVTPTEFERDFVDMRLVCMEPLIQGTSGKVTL